MIYSECHHNKNLARILVVSLFVFFASCSQSLESHLERGEQYLKERKYDAALMQFRAAVNIDDSSPEAHWGLARALEKNDKFLETIESLQKTVNLKPANLQAQSKLGNYFLLFNPPQVSEAEKVLATILKQDKKNIEGHILKASILTAQGKSEDEVVRVLRKAISFNKKRSESYLALSRYYMRIKNEEKAESAIQESIEANPKRSLGYIEYGRFYTFQNKIDEAEEQFQKAEKAEPDNIEAGLAIASFYATNDKYEKAENKYQSLVKVQKNSPESLMDLGEFYVLADREKDAIDTFQQILKDNADYARARYALTEIHLSKRDFAKADKEIENLLAVNDQDAKALLLRARRYLADNKAEEAIKDLESVLKKQPSLRDALYYMATARLSIGQISQAKAFIGDLEKYHPNFRKALLLKIQAAFASGETETALREANLLVFRAERAYVADAYRAQEIQTLRINGMTSRGIAYLQLGKVKEALADLTKVAEMSPSSAGAKVNLARVYRATGDLDKAKEIYEAALENEKDNFDALSGLTAILNRKGNQDESRSLIAGAVKDAGNDKGLKAALHFLRAGTFNSEGDAKKAEAEYKKAIELDKNYLPAYSAYASLLISRNETDAALKQYQQVVSKRPSASVYTLIGMLEDGRGKLGAAEKHYRKALEINPDTPIAANNLAWLIADTGKGNLDEAMRLAQDVTKMNPKVASYYDTLGWVYYKKGFKDQSVEQFRKAVQLEEADARANGRTPDPGYRLRLGLALHKAGDKSRARAEVAAALKTGAQFRKQEIAKAKEVLGDG